jgi:acetoin utilization deacetylase AcuC-like enzyme
MPSTGIITHDRFLEHDTGPGHPERPDRLRAIVRHLKKKELWDNLQHLLMEEAPEEWILNVHTSRHVRFIREACSRGITMLDQGDTHVSKESYDVARLAAGGTIAAVGAVMSGVLRNVFCALRPPGHHAESDTPMGFCLFNNAAIAARYAQEKFGIRRVAIVDWDVHHGNGTQEIFYADSSVFYISLHQFPFYPGTGSKSESGTGKGEGYTLNVPLKSGSGEKEYVEAFTVDILPRLHLFRPELLIISAGFDAHRDDPLANMELTEASFATMTRMLMDVADRHAGGKIVSLLEGGYNLQALAYSVEAHITELMKS